VPPLEAPKVIPNAPPKGGATLPAIPQNPPPPVLDRPNDLPPVITPPTNR
jgi:hypothetical protein